MSYIQTVSRIAFLASFFLAACVGNSARATLFPSEHFSARAPSGNASYGSLLPNFLIQESIPSWNSAGPSNPEIEFNLLGWSPADDLPQVVNQVPEVYRLSELRLAGPPLGNDQVALKATYLATQLLETQIAADQLTGVRNGAPNLRLALRSQTKSSVSWVTLVEFSVYGSLALLALGAVGLTVFNWNRRRLKRLKFERFSNIQESDLMMARLSQPFPPGSWAEFNSLDESFSPTNGSTSSSN